MSKAEWGLKRICLKCDKPFYDLQKDPIVCPNCGETISVEDFLRLQVVNAGKVKRSIKGKVTEEIEIIPTDDTVFDEADDDLALIEDASDLVDDEHDMAEVIDNVEKPEE